MLLSGANHVPLRSERPQRFKRLRAGASGEQLCLTAPAPEGPGGRPMLLCGDEALALHAGAGLPPGTRGVLLRGGAGGKVQVADRVWSTRALALSKGERPEDKCFGVILSRQGDDKRKHLCSQGMQGPLHADLTSAAHTLDGFDFEKDSKTFSRMATPKEQAEYNAKYPPFKAGKRTVQGFRQPTAQ